MGAEATLQDSVTAGAVTTEASARRRRPRRPRDATRTFALTFLMVAILAAFLSPVLRAVMVSLKTPDQLSETNAPFLPSLPQTFEFEGKSYDIYVVNIDGVDRSLALFKPGRAASQFIDPANPSAAAHRVAGVVADARTGVDAVAGVEQLRRRLGDPRFPEAAVQHARDRHHRDDRDRRLVHARGLWIRPVPVPGADPAVHLLIATIFLPSAVTLVPTYTIFSKIGWVGTWLPLLVPTFFANAFDVFLVRQYMLTIPREMDEAASIDGAGPFRTLVSVILPQAWPAIVAVAIFHLVYSWNDFFDPLIYLSTKPELQTLAVGLQKFNGIHYRNPAYVQAGTLMTMVIPVLLFLVFQRVFVRGVVISGVEK